MRVLITGSSGQIGTNLGLRLLSDGHEVFGVDKRQNGWTDAFPTLSLTIVARARTPGRSLASMTRPASSHWSDHFPSTGRPKARSALQTPQGSWSNSGIVK